MEIKSGWYLIEQDQLHRVLTHEDFAKLEPDSYVLHQVFPISYLQVCLLENTTLN